MVARCLGIPRDVREMPISIPRRFCGVFARSLVIPPECVRLITRSHASCKKVRGCEILPHVAGPFRDVCDMASHHTHTHIHTHTHKHTHTQASPSTSPPRCASAAHSRATLLCTPSAARPTASNSEMSSI
jgi:hypothetical protein